ncbi:MAG: PepSY domain-containing protein [Burkholderiales bacterium]
MSSAETPARAGVHRLFWRVHFWAGLITAPLVLFAALTGLLYVFTPQIEARVHADVDRVPATTVVQTLDAQLAAATAALPGGSARSIVPAATPGETTQVLFARQMPTVGAHAGHPAEGQHSPGLPEGRIVYVNPASAQVVGQLAEIDRFRNWARKLHSSFLQGDGWRWPLELAASWMLLMFATGITMWWPRPAAQGGPGWRALLPRIDRGRATWRDLHTSVGVVMSALLIVVLVTGLTWSRHAGDNFRAAQQALGQSSPKPPAELRSSASAGASRASAQRVFEVACAECDQAGISAPLQLTLPKGPQGTWRADTLARDDPTQRLSLAIDAGNGQVLYRSGWRELPLLSKATAVGIPFHRAEFGVWNQVLIAAAALAAIFAVVSGFVMWWKRRPARRMGAPALGARQLRAVPFWLWPLTAALALLMPVFGISLAVFIAVELMALVWHRRFSHSSVA